MTHPESRMTRARCKRCERIFRSSLVVLVIIVLTLAWLNRDKLEQATVSPSAAESIHPPQALNRD